VIECWGSRRFDFVARSTALLVIDMQRDFLDPDGMAAVEGVDTSQLRAVVATVTALIAAAREAGVRVIHTREGYAPDLSDVSAMKAARGSVGTSGPLGRFLIRGEAGHDFAAGLEPLRHELVVDKPGFSAFYMTDLEPQLRSAGIDHLIFCGITTQCCVHSTLRAAVDRGFYCLTVADACAALDPEVHAAALRIIQAEDHLFGWIADSSAVLAALGTPATR
jgi:nicotinamidase-related amidase